jgi:tetratricopeptide (TPR) repeat protein
MEWVVSQTDLLMTGMEYVDAHPECYRLMDVIGANGSVRLGRYGWERGEQTLDRTIRERISEMPKLPPKVSDLLASAPADPKIGEPPLTQALRDARFDGEASWGMLAELIQQTRFLHAYRYSEYMRIRKSSVPDPKLVADKSILVGNHPYLPLLAHLAVRTPEDREAILKVVKQMRLSEISLHVNGRFLNVVNTLVDANRLTPMYRRMHGHTDPTYYDLLGPVMFSKGEDPKYLHRLLLISPYSPNGRARAIALEWDRYESRIESWRNDGHSVVLAALAKHYADAKEDERAIELYQAALRGGADRPTYLELADLYERRKDEPKWLETLVESLNLDRGGVDWAKTNHKIAHHYMKAREWEKALPYAEKAASTKSGGGMIAAGRCHLALEHFDRSEELFAATSNRYAEDVFEWYAWCKLTGRGSVDDARELVEKQLKAEGDRVTQAKGVRNAIYYLLSNQDLEAAKLLNRILVKSNDERVRMYYFVAADRVRNAEARDQAVKSFLNQPGERAAVLRMIGESGPAVPLDLRKINATLAQMPAGSKMETAMVVGLFLSQHGQPKAAIRYLQQPPPIDITMIDALAASALRDAEAKAAKK